MKVCNKCGATNEELSKFCSNCGSELEIKVEQQEVQEPQQAVQPQPQPVVLPMQGERPVVVSQPETKKSGSNVLGIIALIVAILSLVCCYFDVFALILSVVAIVLSIISLAGKKGKKGLAIAALIIGIIGFLIALSLVIFAYAIIPNSPDIQRAIEEAISQYDWSSIY